MSINMNIGNQNRVITQGYWQLKMKTLSGSPSSIICLSMSLSSSPTLVLILSLHMSICTGGASGSLTNAPTVQTPSIPFIISSHSVPPSWIGIPGGITIFSSKFSKHYLKTHSHKISKFTWTLRATL